MKYVQLEKFKPRLEEQDGHGSKEDHVKLKKTNGPVNKEEDEAKLDQKAPDPDEEIDIHEVNLQEETQKPLYKEDDTQIDDHEALNPVYKDGEEHVVKALPLSFKLPHDSDAVTSAMKNKKVLLFNCVLDDS